MTGDLPAQIRAMVVKHDGVYRIAQKDLEALALKWNQKDVEAFLADCNKILDGVDSNTAVFVRQVVHRVVVFESLLASRRIEAPPRVVTAVEMDAIDRRVYQTLIQQTQTTRTSIQDVVMKGYNAGATLEDKRAFQQAIINQGIVGLQRSDGSALSLEATGKAITRTAVNQLQSETALTAYQSGGVKQVQFVAGGPCTFKGDGGTCEDLDGTTYPVDDIPPEVQIPRHLYSQSRWLPVTS